MASLIQHGELFYLQFCNKNKQPRLKVIPLRTRSEEAAKRLKVRYEDQYALGQFDPWAEESETETVKRFGFLEYAVQQFLQTRKHLRPASVEAYARVLLPFRRYMGGQTRTVSIKPKHILQWLDSTKANRVTRRKYVRHLAVFFNYGIKIGALRDNPAKGVRLEKVPHKFPQFLYPEDVERLVQTITEHAKQPGVRGGLWLIPLIKANVYLGLRAGEICNLQWSHVSLRKKRLIVTNTEDFTTKSGRERIVPISDQALEVLTALDLQRENREEDTHVFKSTPRSGKLNPMFLSHRFTFFARLAGLKGKVTFHTTRHTACSWLAMKGVSIEAIRQFAGHSSISVTQRYMHLAPQSYQNEIISAFSKVDSIQR